MLDGGKYTFAGDQLRSLLRPGMLSIADENPGGAGITAVIADAAHDGGVAVGGDRDRAALANGRPGITAADQLRSLLCPHPAAAGEHPGRSDTSGTAGGVIAGAAHDGGVAVGGDRDRPTLVNGVPGITAADQLRSLLRPHPAAAGKHPRCSDGTTSTLTSVIAGGAYDGGVAVRGDRDRAAFIRLVEIAAAHKLRALLRKLRQRWVCGVDERAKN